MNPRRAWLLSLPVVAVLLAGCGGGGDDSAESAPTTAETTTAVTKAELLERGDAICAEVNAAVGTVGASSGETGDPTEQVAGLYAGMVDSLKGIGTPQETTGYPEFIAAAEALATAEDEVELAAERGDAAALESAESSASSALADFQSAAEEYGFEECGEGPSAPPASGGAAPEAGETGSAEAPEEPEAEAVEPEAEPAPEPAPETGGTGGGAEGGGGGGGGESGGIGPG